jgi:hypothetical protein
MFTPCLIMAAMMSFTISLDNAGSSTVPRFEMISVR